MLSTFLVSVWRYTHNGVVFGEGWAPEPLADLYRNVDQRIFERGDRTWLNVRRYGSICDDKKDGTISTRVNGKHTLITFLQSRILIF